MALTDLTRISTSGIATGSTIDAAILRKDVSFRGSQVGVTSALFDSSENELKFNDNSKLKFGDGGDVQLYWTGSAGFLTNQGAAGSNLHVNSDTVLIKNAANSKSHIRAYNNSSVEIFYNNNKKIETTKHGAVVTGILTATGFSGPTNNTSGIATFYDLRVSNNLTVEGTTTTLDTNLIGVDRVEVGANSNTLAGIAVTQSGTADIVRLYDGATQRVTVDDEGKVGIGSDIPVAHLDVANYQNIEVLRLRDRHFNKYLTIRGGGSPNRMVIDSYEGGGGGADIDFASNGSTKVRIASGGNIGLTVADPKSKLHLPVNEDVRIGGQYGGTSQVQNEVSYSSGYTGVHWMFESNQSVSWCFDGVMIINGDGSSSYGSEVVKITIVYSREHGALNSGDTHRNGSSSYNIETLGHDQVGLNPSAGSLSVTEQTDPDGAGSTRSLFKLSWSASGQGVGVDSRLLGNIHWSAAGSSGSVEIQDKDGNVKWNSNP